MSTELGHTQFTRRPDRPNSTAIALVSITTPPFDAVYAALYGNSAEAGDGRHVHDRAARLEQWIERGLAHQEGAGEIDGERAVPVVQRELARGRKGSHARDVCKDVKPSELLDGRSDGSRTIPGRRRRTAWRAPHPTPGPRPHRGRRTATRAPSLVSRSTVAAPNASTGSRHQSDPVVEAAH